MPTRVWGVVASVALVLSIGGCRATDSSDDDTGGTRDTPQRGDATGMVEVTSPTATASCASFLDALPDQLDEAPRRTVRPADASSAAYGDPVIEVTCDAPRPEGFTKFSPCQEVNGIGWYAPESAEDDQADGTTDAPVTLTTIGIRPRVSVSVPAAWRPPAGVLVDLSNAIDGALKKTRSCI